MGQPERKSNEELRPEEHRIGDLILDSNDPAIYANPEGAKIRDGRRKSERLL